MRDRRLGIYCRGSDFPIEGVLKVWAEHAITLDHPESGRPSLLNPAGEREDGSLNTILARFEKSKAVDFLMWASPSTQIYVNLRSDGRAIVQTYEISALRQALLTIKDVALELFRLHESAGTFQGLYLDAEGVADGFDWDPFFSNDMGVPGGCIEMIILSSYHAHLMG